MTYKSSQAFPRASNVRGMSLRDYFAGQALAGLLSSNVEVHYSKTPTDILAYALYTMANAMLKEREKS